MDKRMKELLQYEKRLIEDRQCLHKLEEQSDVKDYQFIKEKMEHFQQELQYMEHQVEILKSSYHMDDNTIVQMAQSQSMHTQDQQIHSESIQPQEKFQKTSNEIPSKTQPIVDKRDMEKTVGKSFMGILASGLIFISLILFATLLLPYFNDTAKMITTYLVSFTFTALGLFRLKKDKENKFYIALAGCGVGAIYISLLLSNLYFKVMGDITLYILICIWGIGVCCLGKFENKVFQVIGEMGILISVFFGCILCDTKDDELKFMVLIIYYIISTTIFYLVHYEEEFNGNLMYHIFHVINVGIFLLAATDIVEKGTSLSYIMLLLLVVANLVSIFCNKLEKSNIPFGIFSAIYIVITNYLVYKIFGDELVSTIILYVSAIIVIAVTEMKKMNGKAGKYILCIAGIITGTIALDNYDNLHPFAVVPLLILPLLLVGFLRKNTVCKYTTLLLLFVFTYGYWPMEQGIHYVIEFVVLLVVFYFIYRCKDQYSRVYKYCSHMVTIIFLNLCTSQLIRTIFPEIKVDDECVYILLVIFNLAMMKSRFGKNLKTMEQEKPAFYNIINMILMITGTFVIGDTENVIFHMLMIFTVTATFMVNAKNILDKRDNIFGGMYVGLKFVILLIVILNSFDTVNYFVSIACFIFAILSIILGFAKDYKALRIFGLIVSMTSTFKLIMVDITYENTLGNALSFFISGILCFVISLIYNYIDGRIKKE